MQEYFTDDPIYKKLSDKLEKICEEDDSIAYDDLYCRWYLLKDGVSIKHAVNALLKSKLFPLFVCENFFIRINDTDVLPVDSEECKAFLNDCTKNRVIIIQEKSENQFISMNDNRIYKVSYNYVIGAWDKTTMFMEPINV